MTEKLAENLDDTIRIIASRKNTTLYAPDVRRLVIARYITINIVGGWMVNSKGREYLKRHNK